MECSLCHTQNDEDARFCKSCGAPLDKQEEKPAEKAEEKSVPQKVIQMRSHSWMPVLFFPLAVLGILLISFLFSLFGG